jgi:hypothetical protein
MRLSPNFDRSEFERDGSTMPSEDVVTAYVQLCVAVLEPLHAWAREPFHITSGYRDAAANKRVTGDDKPSQHIATADHCAVDGYFETYHAHGQPVFEWLRMKSNLLFDQLILEHGKYGDTLHISWSKTPRREALEGQTFHRGGYEAKYVAPIVIDPKYIIGGTIT